VLTAYARGADGQIAQARDAADAIAAGEAVWIDLLNPTPEEEQRVEAAFAIDAPTPAERTALEDSARLYEENGALVLTATVLSSRDTDRFASDAVSFVLTKGSLITVREIDSRAFQIGAGRASARIQNAASGAEVFLALMEGLVERTADILQAAATKAQTLSHGVFTPAGRGPNMDDALSELGRLGAVATQSHASLSSLERLFTFAQNVCEKHALSGPRLAGLARDASQLERTADALQNHLTFLLDAALGLVAAAQNASLQRLSVTAMVFVPSTLIASIFGMNFDALTIFHARWGPWFAFALMLIATLAALSYARYRRWI
jgi:magnesium transporter